MYLDQNCPGGAFVIEWPDDFHGFEICDVHWMGNNAKALRLSIENSVYAKRRVRMIVYCHRDMLRVALETGVTKRRP
jgi:hypothetical protein